MARIYVVHVQTSNTCMPMVVTFIHSTCQILNQKQKTKTKNKKKKKKKKKKKREKKAKPTPNIVSNSE